MASKNLNDQLSGLFSDLEDDTESIESEESGQALPQSEAAGGGQPDSNKLTSLPDSAQSSMFVGNSPVVLFRWRKV